MGTNSTWGNYDVKRGVGILAGLEILVSLQFRYGFPSAQEEDNALARFDLPMNYEDPLKS